MPSTTDRINFSLRPNKSVARKLIFDPLRELEDFPIPSYRYLGFGAIWFTDFLLAHKHLGITKMLSIEQSSKQYTRAEYNKPYACIEVKNDWSSNILPDLKSDLGECPFIAWLDYDTSLLHASIEEDVQHLCDPARSGSIVVVTVNSEPISYGGKHSSNSEAIDKITKTLDNTRIDDDAKLARIRGHVESIKGTNAHRRAAMEESYGKYMPPNLSNSDFSGIDLQKTLASTVSEILNERVYQDSFCAHFEELYRMTYKDGARMLTVGGMIVDEEDRKMLAESTPFKGDTYGYFGSKELLEIDVPPLTVKEKMALDQLLPMDSDVEIEELEEQLEFSLAPSQVQSYSRFYKEYPVYGELRH